MFLISAATSPLRPPQLLLPWCLPMSFIEPISYKATLVSPHSADGQKAVQLEFDSVTTSRTRDLAPVPAGCRVVNNVCVYKAQTGAYGVVLRDKARFVAKSCIQREGPATTPIHLSPANRLVSLRHSSPLRLLTFSSLGALP
jgi:hypothetical protein